MKPTSTDNITCLLLGHNFYRKGYANMYEDEVVCKNCGTKMYMDEKGDINNSASSDKALEKALRKLFLLKRRLHSGL